MIQPRDYQLEAVSAARAEFRNGQPTSLIVLPTGSGKSATAAEFLRQLLEAKPDYRALVVVPRASIIDSFVRAISSHTKTTPTIAAASSHGVDLTGQIVVGMWQTLSRRALPSFDLVIADEAHGMNQRDANSGYFSLITQCMAQGSKLLAFTATPFRQDGYIYGPSKLFPYVTYSKTLRWTTDNGFTVRAVLKAGAHEFDTNHLEIDATGNYTASSVDWLVLDTTRMQAQVTDLLERSRDRKKIAVACANIKHAEDVAALLRSHGERVSVVTSHLDINARSLQLGDFETEPTCRFLVFVSILSEGFDFPPIDCIVFLRPCRSSNFYVQCIGRGLRPAPNKTDCLVLDYGQVVRNCGPLDAPIVNRSTGKNATLQELAALPHDIMQCSSCGAFLFPDKNAPSVVCTECHAPQVKPERVVDKKLEKRAEEEAKLYADQVDEQAFETAEWEVTAITVETRSFTTTGKRQTKYIICELSDGTFLSFMVNNPAFAPTTQLKFYFHKMEKHYSQLLQDFSGTRIDLRRTDSYTLTKKNRVCITAKRRKVNLLVTHRPYDTYKSHHRINVHDEGTRGRDREVDPDLLE